MSSFEVHAGNGRLYALSVDAKAKERERMDAKAAQGGNDWLKNEPVPDFDGMLIIDQTFVNYLQAGVSASTDERVRMNWKGYKAKKVDGSPQLNLQGAYMKGVGDFKSFKKAVAGSAEPAQAPVQMDDFDEDDPF